MALEGVRVALDPSPRQEGLLLSHAGAARFAFNAGLAHVKEQLEARAAAKAAGVPEAELPGVDWSLYTLRRWWNAEKAVLAPWWAENSKEAYSSGLDALARALKSWSDSRRGRRRGKHAGFPQFKSRARARAAWAYTTGSFGIADRTGVQLPRIGRVHTHEQVQGRIGEDRIVRATVSRTGGRWFVVFTVERATRVPIPPSGAPIGVDLGLKTLAVISDGRVIENPKHLADAQRRLTTASRAYARTQPGSSGRRHAADRLAKLHARVGYLREDALHKFTTNLACTHGTIVIEDLNVAGMMKNRSFARAIADASFGEFRRQLAYKATKFGSTLVVADRWMPSSKTCSNCGTVKTKLSLSERTFRCEHCDLILDRDLNASRNLAHLVTPSVAGSGPETVNGGRARQKTQQAGQQATKPQPRTLTGSDVDRQPATATT
ncbi:IS607 family element RNA-guided endonuclease TnpB [Plantibacter sp. VKM Ac-2880]|uniref:IS607 family element RNA-guided endonuclease TnpB n=1 Tax=Plantibacter sp. VKM Ac-2880 TaxID=2783827 RepID=UPI00351C274F